MIISNVEGKIWLALKNRIGLWTECPVMFPEQNYEPSATDGYLFVQHVTTEYGGIIPIDMKCGQPLNGILNISVLVPTDFGFDAHIGRAGRVADFFSPAVIMGYSDVKVKLNGRPRVLGSAQLQTPWNRIEVQIPWIAWG